MGIIQSLLRPFIGTTSEAIARRGEQTMAREASGVVAKDVAKKVLGTDARVVASATVKKAAGKDVAHVVAAELPKIKIKTPLRLVGDAKLPLEAPRLSPDRQTLVYGMKKEHWLPEWFKKLIKLPEDQAPETLTLWARDVAGKAEPRKLAGRTFKNAAQPAFTPDGKALIYLEQKHPFAFGQKIEEMRMKKIDLATGKATTIYDGAVNLLHPQVHPNGKQIVAYSRVKGKEGIYVLDAANPMGSAPVRLTSAADKHPIWSSDGKRIYFHTQQGGNVGGGDVERAWLGYIDMTDPKAPKRVLLDDIANGANTYHKHPTPLGDSGLVAYHAVDPTTDKKFIGLLDTNTGERARLAFDGVSPGGAELKQFKHPAFSDDGQALVLAGKGKKEDARPEIPEEWRIYMLDRTEQIVSAFKEAFKK